MRYEVGYPIVMEVNAQWKVHVDIHVKTRLPDGTTLNKQTFKTINIAEGGLITARKTTF